MEVKRRWKELLMQARRLMCGFFDFEVSATNNEIGGGK